MRGNHKNIAEISGDQGNFIETQPKSSDPSPNGINNDRPLLECIVYVFARAHVRVCVRICVCVCVCACVRVCGRAPLHTYGDIRMNTHQQSGVCSNCGDIFKSPQKSPLKYVVL